MASPAVLGYLLWRTVGQRRGGRYLRQRLGWGLPKGPFDFWFHCVSVGEVQAAAPLVQALAAAQPGRRFLVTTCTATGAETAARQLPPSARHAYLPVDLPGAVRRFFRRTRPRCAFIVETELWPHLFRGCHKHGIPLYIINGRLSEKTLRAPAWLRAAFRSALSAVDACLARSAEDAGRFEELGLPGERIRVLGNLKFARTGAIAEEAPAEPPLPYPYALAGSTHTGEEARLGALWKQQERNGRLLVIAPRHPQRRNTILRELRKLDLNVAVRSWGEAVTADTEVYLADTLGELTWFMAHAEVVFLGGSLVPIGGHNLLEPAALGRSVVVGPHMEKFQSECDELCAAGGAVQVGGSEELEALLPRLLADRERRRAIGEAGRCFVGGQEGVLERYLETLGELLPERLGPRTVSPGKAAEVPPGGESGPARPEPAH
ncbi:MAG: 3-deoxy-D-manno-octulosonic acid transferase [Thiohalorhabdus sp.]|uniref:3-deoxy-D-manno-octulosonic acid transferase n=1 Tax=Thiohalorhabdus sp. TaxID=3094134 RepID=UPI0039815F8D